MMNDKDKLKKAAAPNSERIALAVESLVVGQITNNIRLQDICDYKEQQKLGDIKFRKKSTTLSLFGIGIALVALYISVAGYGKFAHDVILCLDWVGGLL